jgi:hypothetical protein
MSCVTSHSACLALVAQWCAYAGKQISLIELHQHKTLQMATAGIQKHAQLMIAASAIISSVSLKEGQAQFRRFVARCAVHTQSCSQSESKITKPNSLSESSMPAAGDFASSVWVGGGHIQLEEYHDVSAQLLPAIKCYYCIQFTLHVFLSVLQLSISDCDWAVSVLLRVGHVVCAGHIGS